MKFTVPVQTIIGPISQVSNICVTNSRNPDDLAQFILFDVKTTLLTLVGTDNNVQLKAEIPLPEGACTSEGTFLMLASKAGEFFKSLGSQDDVSMELVEEEDILNIESNQANFSIRIRKLVEDNPFPIFRLDNESSNKSFAIAENKLRYMLDKSVFCVSKDNYRDYLKGVRFELEGNHFTIFALDGHRMAALETDLDEAVPEEIKFLMSLRGVNELQKLLNNNQSDLLTLQVSENFVSTQINNYTITTCLLKCRYPDVRKVIPSQCAPELAVPLDLLKTYVKRVSLFSNKRLNLINLLFTHNTLTLFSQNSEHELGSAKIGIDYPDTEGHRESNLNADFLKEFLNAIDTEQVVFGFAPPYSNTMLRPINEVNDLGIRARYVVSHIVV